MMEPVETRELRETLELVRKYETDEYRRNVAAKERRAERRERRLADKRSR